MTQEIIKNLKDSGSRITPARKAILDVLDAGHALVSAQDIKHKLERKKISVNKTTVYRELEFLLRQDIVREVDLGEGKKRFEINQGCHHHLVCKKCGKIDEVEIANDLSHIEKKISRVKNFKVQKHTVEFFGLCKKCQ